MRRIMIFEIIHGRNYTGTGRRGKNASAPNKKESNEGLVLGTNTSQKQLLLSAHLPTISHFIFEDQQSDISYVDNTY